MRHYKKPDYVDSYDFYRCMKCNGLITHMQMEDRVSSGKVCDCGALKYAPVNLKWWQYFMK